MQRGAKADVGYLSENPKHRPGLVKQQLHHWSNTITFDVHHHITPVSKISRDVFFFSTNMWNIALLGVHSGEQKSLPLSG